MPNRVEEMASKAMGAVKSTKASIKGLSGVFKELTKEHGEVTALLLRVKSTSDPNVRRELFPTIRKELLSHEQGELRVVYPAFREHAELRSIAEQHERESQQMEQLIETLHRMPCDDLAWPTRFAELVDAVQRHTAEEENDFFPKAESLLGEERAQELESTFMGCKQDTMNTLN